MDPHPSDCLCVFHLVSLSLCQSVCIFVILLLYKESRGLAWKKKGFHSIPAAQEAGRVLVTVYTEAGRQLGVTYFTYVDEVHQALKQLIRDPAQISLFLTMWSQEHGIIGSSSDVVQTPGLFSLPDQGIWIWKRSWQYMNTTWAVVKIRPEKCSGLWDMGALVWQRLKSSTGLNFY